MSAITCDEKLVKQHFVEKVKLDLPSEWLLKMLNV